MAEPALAAATAPADARPRPGADALGTWRHWLTRHPVGGALLAGAVATHMATMFGIWFHGIGLPDLNWPAVNGAVIFPKADGVAQYWAGFVAHSLDGLVFALLYALLVHPQLPFRNSNVGNVVKGMLYGTVLAVVSIGFMVPYVYFPHSGAGVFSTGFGFKLIFAVFLWHWAYGFFLGTVYDPAEAD
jgi:hypothetical protein